MSMGNFAIFSEHQRGALMKERIKELCRGKGISVNKLEEELGFAKGYISKLGKTNPSSQKLKQIADYFGVSLEYLTTGSQPDSEIPYYINDDAREMAQFLYENPDYKVLFDASRKVSKKDLDTVKAIIDKFKDPNLD